MNLKKQARTVELQRRIRMAVAALQAVERSLDLEHDGDAISPDALAERIRDHVKAASRAKNN
jgi:hypothetical protein